MKPFPLQGRFWKYFRLIQNNSTGNGDICLTDIPLPSKIYTPEEFFKSFVELTNCCS